MAPLSVCVGVGVCTGKKDKHTLQNIKPYSVNIILKTFVLLLMSPHCPPWNTDWIDTKHILRPLNSLAFQALMLNVFAFLLSHYCTFFPPLTFELNEVRKNNKTSDQIHITKQSANDLWNILWQWIHGTFLSRWELICVPSKQGRKKYTLQLRRGLLILRYFVIFHQSHSEDN